MFGLIPWRREKEERSLSQPAQSPFDLFRREFDSLFDRFFGDWPALTGSTWGSPGWGLGVEDTGKEVVVRAEAPGFEASDFDVQVSGDVLTIRAEHKEEGDGKEGQRRYARLERSVTLPAGTDVDKVEARYRNGVLELHLPKLEEAQPRRIEVKA